MCSGLASGTEKLGCGAISRQFEKRIDNCVSNTLDHMTTLYRSEGTLVEQLNATFVMNLVPVLSVVISSSTLLVIAAVLLVLLLTKLNKLHKGEKHSSNGAIVARPLKIFNYHSQVNIQLQFLKQRHVILSNGILSNVILSNDMSLSKDMSFIWRRY